MTSELTKAQAEAAIKDGLSKIIEAIDAVRTEGEPLQGTQLHLHIELVREAKVYLAGYIQYLDLENEGYWHEARVDEEPAYVS